MHIYKNTWFQRFARREKITDQMLIDVITRAEEGLIDADLGGNIIKQRVARKGQGKSGGYRTIIVFKQDDKAFFVYGFAKSERENIDKNEIDVFKQSAKELLELSDQHLQELIENGRLTEVKSNE
ncbi:MAG: type II toxin-antitoxin system RelE/ParE family toxin [Methylococcales bacterium]